MKNSEEVKKVVDDFGRLSFMLESYVKLVQTGDHPGIADEMLYACREDAGKLYEGLKDLCETKLVVGHES